MTSIYIYLCRFFSEYDKKNFLFLVKSSKTTFVFNKLVTYLLNIPCRYFVLKYD